MAWALRVRLHFKFLGAGAGKAAAALLAVVPVGFLAGEGLPQTMAKPCAHLFVPKVQGKVTISERSEGKPCSW